MRAKIFLGFILISIALISCEKEDVDEVQVNNNQETNSDVDGNLKIDTTIKGGVLNAAIGKNNQEKTK